MENPRSKKQRIKRLQSQCANDISVILETYTQSILDLFAKEEEEEEEEEEISIVVQEVLLPPPIHFDKDPEFVTMSCRLKNVSHWIDVNVLLVYANGKRWFVQSDIFNVPAHFALNYEGVILSRHRDKNIESCKIYKGTQEFDTLKTMGLSCNHKYMVLLDYDALRWTDFIKIKE